MNVTETSLGLLFSEKPIPKWIELFAFVFLVALFFLIREVIKTYKEQTGRQRNRTLIIYFGICIILTIGISFVYPINQYRNSNYQVSINYKGINKEIIINSGEPSPIYKNTLNNYKGYYVIVKYSSLKDNNRNSIKSYQLNIVRKDGLLVSLGTYQTLDWNIVLSKIKKTNLPELDEVTYALRSPTNDEPVKLNYDYLKLSENLKNIKTISSQNNIEVIYGKHANPVITKCSIIILIILWLFVFSQITSGYPGKKIFYIGIPLSVFFTSTVILFNLSYLNTKQHIAFSNNGYKSYIESKILGRLHFYEGKWKDAKIINATIGANENMGIVISEEDFSLNGAVLSNAFNAAINGKYKYVGTEGLDIYNSIILADYVLSMNQNKKNETNKAL